MQDPSSVLARRAHTEHETPLSSALVWQRRLAGLRFIESIVSRDVEAELALERGER